MIIFISGSINAGKTTVGKLLAKELGKAAFIEVDCLRGMIEWMPLEESIPLNLRNAAALIKNFSREGIHAVVAYPLSKRNYEFLREELGELSRSLRVFTLSPKIEVAQSDRGDRKLDDWERDRISHHYQTGISNPEFGTIIDNSEETPEQTVKRIFSSLKTT